MFITSSLPATSDSRAKNGRCLSLESGGSAKRTSPGTAANMQRSRRPRSWAGGPRRIRLRSPRSWHRRQRLHSGAPWPSPASTSIPFSPTPTRWGVSIAQLGDLILACLDASVAESVAEVGAFAGDLTRVLVDWARGAGAQSSRSTRRRKTDWSRSTRRAPELSAHPRDEPRSARRVPAAGHGDHRRRPQLLHRPGAGG